MISKTCSVGHLSHVATLLGNWKILMTVYTSLLHTVATCLSWILATVPYLVLCFLYKFSLPMLADTNSSLVFLIIVYKSQNPHSLAELPVVHPTSIVSPWVWTIYWNFLVATDPILYCNAPLHWQGYVHAFQPDHLSLLSNLYICKRDNTHFI